MPNNLKKVSSLPRIVPSQMISDDLFYYVHEYGGSPQSYSMSIADLFIGTNYLTGDMAFNEDTLYIKNGMIGINKIPTLYQLELNGSMLINGASVLNSTLNVIGQITCQNNITTTRSITATQDLTVGGKGLVQSSMIINGAFTANNTTTITGTTYIANNAIIANDFTVGEDATIVGTTNVDFIHSTRSDTKQSFAEIINVVYPVGSLYLSILATNPAIIFGVGTWSAWGSGRVPVGINALDADFNSPEKIGGAKTHTLTAAQSGLRDHTHGVTDPTHNHGVSDPGHIHSTYVASGETGSSDDDSGWNPLRNMTNRNSTSSKTNISINLASTGISINNSGSDGAVESHNNLQPYIVCYMWKRIA